MPFSGCDTFRYRAARREDEPFLWRALYYAIYMPAGHAPPPPDIVHRPELARYVDSWSPEMEPGIVAEAAPKQRIGAAWLRMLRGKNAGYGYVADDIPELSIAVLPAFRNKGAGTAMLQRLLEIAPGRFPGVSLSVGRSNPARHLYERLRFEEVTSSVDALTMLRRF